MVRLWVKAWRNICGVVYLRDLSEQLLQRPHVRGENLVERLVTVILQPLSCQVALLHRPDSIWTRRTASRVSGSFVAASWALFR